MHFLGENLIYPSQLTEANATSRNGIPQMSNGLISCNTPQTDYNCANKLYIDTIAETKVSKYTTSSGFNKVFVQDIGGNMLDYQYLMIPTYFNETNAHTRNGVAGYRNGNIGCAIPLEDYHTANKKYVDAQKKHLHVFDKRLKCYKYIPSRLLLLMIRTVLWS